jgi:hypothetical protein
MMERAGERQATTDDIASGGRPGEGQVGSADRASSEGGFPAEGGGPADGAPGGERQPGGEGPAQREGELAAGGSPAEGGAATRDATAGGAPAEGGVPPEDARASAGGGAPGRAAGDDHTPLLPDQEARDFEGRWERIQVEFVDEPQRCVQEADGLVAELMQRLADGFARERKELEGQWASGGEVSTEDLRVALQRYRSFFNRLLRTG